MSTKIVESLVLILKYIFLFLHNKIIWSRGQSEISGLFLIFVAPPRKKNLVAIMSWGHVLGSWKTMFD